MLCDVVLHVRNLWCTLVVFLTLRIYVVRRVFVVENVCCVESVFDIRIFFVRKKVLDGNSVFLFLCSEFVLCGKCFLFDWILSDADFFFGRELCCADVGLLMFGICIVRILGY